MYVFAYAYLQANTRFELQAANTDEKRESVSTSDVRCKIHVSVLCICQDKFLIIL